MAAKKKKSQVQPAKSFEQLGELQKIVLETVWQLENATVQDVIDALKPQRKPAYTTVLTTLQNLTKSGWIRPEKSGKAYIYHPTKSRDQANGYSIATFVRRAFNGNARAMLQSLLDHQELSEQELAELKKLIDQKRREKKK